MQGQPKTIKLPSPLHPDEQIVEMAVERFWQDDELLVEYALTNGRPVFSVPLTLQEIFQRYRQDPAAAMARYMNDPGTMRDYVNTLERAALRATGSQ